MTAESLQLIPLIQSVLPQLGFEAPRGETERLRGRRSVAFGAVERAGEPRTLGAARSPFALFLERFLSSRRRGGGQVRRQAQVALFDHGALGENHRPLQAVAQLA